MATEIKLGAEAIICNFMEPMPEHRPYSWQSPIKWGNWSPRGWWRSERGPEVHGHWAPRNFTLDALWEVEERLIEQGAADTYRAQLVREDAYFWHATAAQKIKALAEVLRETSN